MDCMLWKCYGKGYENMKQVFTLMHYLFSPHDLLSCVYAFYASYVSCVFGSSGMCHHQPLHYHQGHL